MNLASATVGELVSLVASKEVRAEDIVRVHLDTIEAREPELRAFLTVERDRALERARAIDRKEKIGRLAGVPIAVKDNILVKDMRATCASRILEGFIAPYSATVVERLEAEDAVVIGKTNLDEFGMGSSTENSAFHLTRNPWDPERVPGGSSGGSAAAVAACEAAAALGSDTGGSIRQPAAFCGIVGLKPSYGRVSRYGLVAFASSLDQIGPMTRSVEDAALLTQVISGPDARDSTLARHPVPDFPRLMKDDLGPFRAVRLAEKMFESADPEIRRLFGEAVQKVRSLGAEIRDVEFACWDYALPCYYLLASSEASSNLARYDGVRYGFREPGSGSLEEMYLLSRTRGFGPEVKRRILLGTFALSSGYYDEYYLKAARTRRFIREEFARIFKEADFVLAPTTPEPAFPVGAKRDPVAMYLSDIFTVAASLAGLPAISLPCGLTGDRLPVGFQIIGRPFEEARLFQLAFLLEKKVKLFNS